MEQVRLESLVFCFDFKQSRCIRNNPHCIGVVSDNASIQSHVACTHSLCVDTGTVL